MRILLDTHTFIWFIGGDARLGDAARALILSPTTRRLLSVGSLWEMAIKTNLGRLKLVLSFPDLVRQQVEQNGIDLLAIHPSHLEALRQLPLHHRDPFDRLLIAQALAEGVPVLTHDAAFRAYAVDVVEAGPRSPA